MHEGKSMDHAAMLQDLTAILKPSPRYVGGKGMGLLNLHRLALHAPPAWVLPTDAFTAFIASLGLDPEVEALQVTPGSKPPKEALEAIRQAILTAPLPDGLLAQIRDLRAQWTEVYGERLIVRSSVTVEDSESWSFAGTFESIPCRTDEEVEDAVRRVWASVFSPRAWAYYGIAGLADVPAMALIVQPFVEAHRSGVMFTRFARSGQKPQVLVEHVEGDCEKLVSGQVNPDRFWMPHWPLSEASLLGSTGELKPRIALELARIARTLEEELGRPQDVEWCVRDETLYLLQTRPITAGVETTAAASEGEGVLQGVGASPGRAGGMVHLVFNIEDADALEVGYVLTTTMTNPDMVPALQRSAAVVTDVGGMICHAAIVSRELGIPCVVGTKTATQTLPPGDLVTVDGGTGAVYEGLRDTDESEPLARPLAWADLWEAWQEATPPGTLPLIAMRRALEDIPSGLERCVLDPYADLSLDPDAEITPLAMLSDGFFRSYADRLNNAARQAGLEAVYLDLHRLDPAIRDRFAACLDSPSLPLAHLSDEGAWQIQAAPDGQHVALLDRLSPQAFEEAPQEALLAIPLGFGVLLDASVHLPDAADQGGGGMFGMAPEIRMAPMPARTCREAMHRLIPVLSEAHGGHMPVSNGEVFPWLDVRPEVPISSFLKAFVTPGVEAIPYVMGFEDPPLHVQFIRCRFHFRQDTLMGFFPKLMQATWDEGFLSKMLRRCRVSYDTLEGCSAALPATDEALAHASNHALRELFVAWWRAFTEFFSLSFFIQAQGDDAIFPALGQMAEGTAGLLGRANVDWRVPGLAELSAPVTPVLTAEYVADLLTLKQALNAQGIEDHALAEEAVGLGGAPEVGAAFEHVRARWHWMRERDPYYEPCDTASVIVEKALSIRSTAPPDYAANSERAALALALHFDLARLMGVSEQIIYGIKYGRALAIDRENHHLVWLRASYRLRKLLLEWERRLRVHTNLRPRDIFFMQPWEILDAVDALPEPIPVDLLRRISNRRVAYEQELQLKAGKSSQRMPEPEEDYY